MPPAETLRMQKACSDEALANTRTSEWYKMIKEGLETVEDEQQTEDSQEKNIN